jgi:hypothetical protein
VQSTPGQSGNTERGNPEARPADLFFNVKVCKYLFIDTNSTGDTKNIFYIQDIFYIYNICDIMKTRNRKKIKNVQRQRKGGRQ